MNDRNSNPDLMLRRGNVTMLDRANALQRMIPAGVIPMTWQQVLLEWQRDWARKETYDGVMTPVREHSGAYGMGADYTYTMVHKAPQRTTKLHEALAPVKAA